MTAARTHKSWCLDHTHAALFAMLPASTALSVLGCSTEDPSTGLVRYPDTVPAEVESVAYSDTGKLSGGMEGVAWVAASSLATITSPNPCNDQGCFSSADEGLCTQGRMPALACQGGEDSYDCNYADNWGVMIGLNPQLDAGAWGDAAPETLSVSYSGSSGSYRLTAHLAGDPPGRHYCIDAYPPGLPVKAGRLRTECWSNRGQPLPSFASVDRIGLLLTSRRETTDFNFCISEILLNAPADESRVLVGDDGKLNGPMEGYSWVAAGKLATQRGPASCDTNGCFKNTGGRLCSTGSLPALQCTGQGSADLECNWADNWGSMIGMNPSANGNAWGEAAAESITLDYAGGPGTYQLTAHVAGDPHSRTYCIPNYESGTEVTADMLRRECWKESGASLESFADVDSFGLVLASERQPVEYDYCIDTIRAR